jgi:hypothetical protein
VPSRTPVHQLECSASGQMRLPTACSRTGPGASAVPQEADHIRAPVLVVSPVPMNETAAAVACGKGPAALRRVAGAVNGMGGALA